MGDDEKKVVEIRLSFSEENWEKIKGRAELYDLPITSYCKFVIMSTVLSKLKTYLEEDTEI